MTRLPPIRPRGTIGSVMPNGDVVPSPQFLRYLENITTRVDSTTVATSSFPVVAVPAASVVSLPIVGAFNDDNQQEFEVVPWEFG